jgi:hypothetical protein
VERAFNFDERGRIVLRCWQDMKLKNYSPWRFDLLRGVATDLGLFHAALMAMSRTN